MEKRIFGFLFAQRPMLWEREHSFQKAAYCYDTFQCNANGRLSLLYWARLESPFSSELREDTKLDSKLRTLHWTAEAAVVNSLFSAASLYEYRSEEEQFYDEEDTSSDYYFEVVSSDKCKRLRSKGLPTSLERLQSEIRRICHEHIIRSGAEPMYTDPRLVFASQKHFLFNPKAPSFGKNGALIVPKGQETNE